MRQSAVDISDLDLSEDEAMIFPAGLPGLSDYTRYALLSDEETWPFYHLQSLENAQLCFLTVDPFAFFPDYDFELSEAVVKQLQLTSMDDVWVRNIVVVADDFKQSTVNLQAPLIMNHRTRIGRQVILNDPSLAIKEPLFPRVSTESGNR